MNEAKKSIPNLYKTQGKNLETAVRLSQAGIHFYQCHP